MKKNCDNTKYKKDHTENTNNQYKTHPKIKPFKKRLKKGKYSLYLGKKIRDDTYKETIMNKY